MELDYFVVDVFTETGLAGNPLAVVMNTVNLSSERMQAIAREFNLSETTFVARRLPAVERVDGVRVRIFTTQEELPFAGHPTLGSACVIKMQAPETLQGDTLTLSLNVGQVPVRFGDAPSGSGALFGEMTQHDAEFGEELEAKEAAWLMGLLTDDLDPALPPQIVSTGTAFAIVTLRSYEALERLQVSQREATRWLRENGARWFYVLGPMDGKEPGWRARMQFNGGEDPATGSAAGCAIAYLVKRGAVASGERILLRQGVEIGRPSDLYLSAKLEGGTGAGEPAKVTGIHVGGSTVLVAKGKLILQ
ncbi:MAG: PhzF family phenazine biosynthesis protein [Terracidiphilus sp.]